jgi:hypothetical protein
MRTSGWFRLRRRTSRPYFRHEDLDTLANLITLGARVTKEPVDAEFFTGRSAYLCDPEDNYFEIAWADEPDNPVLAATRRAAGA